MKLFYSPGACSLSPHIVLREAGASFDLERVDLKTKRTQAGADYLAINPKGQVPTLQLDDGEFLTEGPAIVQYIADRNPKAGLAPAAGTMPRYRLIEWLNYITSELHKSIGALFQPTTPDAYKTIVKEGLEKKFAYLEGKLAKQGVSARRRLQRGGRVPLHGAELDAFPQDRHLGSSRAEGVPRPHRSEAEGARSAEGRGIGPVAGYQRSARRSIAR